MVGIAGKLIANTSLYHSIFIKVLSRCDSESDRWAETEGRPGGPPSWPSKGTHCTRSCDHWACEPSGSTAQFPPVHSRVRPSIRPAAYTSSRHALRAACSVLQHDCFFPGRTDRCYSALWPWRCLLTSPITTLPPPLWHTNSVPAKPAPRFAHIRIPPLWGTVPLCSTGPALSLLHSAAARVPALVQRRSCSRGFAALRTPSPGAAGSVNSGQNVFVLSVTQTQSFIRNL